MYQRTSTIERADGKPVSETGQVTGILATSGEASDGHILNIAGGQTPRGAPLLFNHDAFEGNLGSWVGFEKSDDTLRGTAQIEMDGIGAKSEWRQDVAFMVDQGHIPAFSLRWDEVKPPIRRVDLPKEHPAFVDAEREQDFGKLYGLYFDKWRMLEGSIVTLPADKGALIGRMRDASKTGAREYWRKICERMAGIDTPTAPNAEDPFSREVLESFDHIDIGELKPIELSDGRTFYVPLEIAELVSERGSIEAPTQDEGGDNTPESTTQDASAFTISREDILSLIREEIAPLYAEVREEWRTVLYQTLGKV